DPIRKLIPDEPVYLTALVAAPLVMTLLGAYLRNVRLSFRPIHSCNKVLQAPLGLFVLLVLVQSVAALIRTGNLVIAGIGALSYLAPLPAILLGYQFSRSGQDIVRLGRVYLVVSLVMISGLYLSYSGYDWTILRSVGGGLVAYSPSGEELVLYSGFLR